MRQHTDEVIPQAGMQVYGSDAKWIGTIDSIDNDSILVKRGVLRDDHYIPRSFVERIDQGRVVLTATSSELEDEAGAVPAQGNSMTVSGQPAENRPDALNEVSTTAKPGVETNLDIDTDVFDDRPDMDSNRRPADVDLDAGEPSGERRQYRPRSS